MHISSTHIIMVEAFLDGELDKNERLEIENIMNTCPELRQLYLALKAQKEAIKIAFLCNENTH